MTLSSYLPSLVDELFGIVKVAFDVPAPPEQKKLDKHFQKPNWKDFEKGMRTKKFRAAAISHPFADDKLKKYVKTLGEYREAKDVFGTVKSSKGSKDYTVKRLASGRLACNCGDWQYVKSHKGGDCKHIKQLKKKGKTKVSIAQMMNAAYQIGAHKRKADKNWRVGQIASLTAQQHNLAERTAKLGA